MDHVTRDCNSWVKFIPVAVTNLFAKFLAHDAENALILISYTILVTTCTEIVQFICEGHEK